MTYAQDQATTWTRIREDWEAGKLGSHDTVSGPGSTLDVTRSVREWLPELFAQCNIKTVLDAPCGDWNWMQHVNLSGIDYTGWDVEPTLIQRNSRRFPQHTFAHKNLLTVHKIPCVDLIICRDFMIHLRNIDIAKLLNKIRASGSHYLLASIHPEASNDDAPEQLYAAYRQRRVDLEGSPFNLVGRVLTIDEPQHPVGCRLGLFDLRYGDNASA